MLAYALVDLRESFLPIAETLADPSREWDVLDFELKTLSRERGAPDAKEARLLREADRMQIWRKTGDPGMLAYIERVLGYGPRSAYDRLRVARALAELPLIEKALAAGELVYSVVRELTRVAVWETEGKWLATAMGKRLREVENAVRGRKEGDDPEAPSRPENVRHVIHHEVDAETYALYCQARRALQEEAGERLDDNAVLATLSRRALQSASGDDGKPAHRIAVTKCDDCKRAWQDGGGTTVELPGKTIERIECDADTMDAHGTVSRHIPAATRRRVLRRDHHRCRVPWCRSTCGLEPHHIEHFARGGNHDPENLITLCWAHHKALHEGVLSLTMDNGDVKLEQSEKTPLPANETLPPSITETAVHALVGLGFKKSEAQSFVATAIARAGKAMTLNDLVREALRASPTKSSR